jgi:hypothetical protein
MKERLPTRPSYSSEPNRNRSAKTKTLDRIAEDTAFPLTGDGSPASPKRHLRVSASRLSPAKCLSALRQSNSRTPTIVVLTVVSQGHAGIAFAKPRWRTEQASSTYRESNASIISSIINWCPQCGGSMLDSMLRQVPQTG